MAASISSARPSMSPLSGAGFPQTQTISNDSSKKVQRVITSDPLTHANTARNTSSWSFRVARERIENWDLLNNIVGSLRQILFIGQNSYWIHMLRHGLDVSTSAMNWINFFGVIGVTFTGISYMAEVLFGTGPEALEARRKAQEVLDFFESNKRGITEFRKKFSTAFEEAREEISIAKANLGNYFFTFWIGAGQTVSAILSALEPASATLFHYSPVLTDAAAERATMVSGVGLGVLYILRGLVYGYKSAKGLRVVSAFKSDFEAAGKEGEIPAEKIQSMMTFMQYQEKYAKELDIEAQKLDPKSGKLKLGEKYLGRRFNGKFLEIGNKTYKADGVYKNGKYEKYKSDKERLIYLKAVNEGIHSEWLKHRLGLVLAVCLILAGIAIIVASTVLSGGMNIAVIGLISAIFYTIRGVFLSGRHSKIFECFRNLCYSEPQWLQALDTDGPELDDEQPSVVEGQDKESFIEEGAASFEKQIGEMPPANDEDELVEVNPAENPSTSSIVTNVPMPENNETPTDREVGGAAAAGGVIAVVAVEILGAVLKSLG